MSTPVSTTNRGNYKALPSSGWLSECYSYDGVDLVWRSDRPVSHFVNSRSFHRYMSLSAGKVAGFVSQKGYRRIKIKGSSMLAHRIIWNMVYGPIPSGMEIDHINGDRSDNRLCNLRVVTHEGNMQNITSPKSNRNGVKGVRQHVKNGVYKDKYDAQITVGGELVRLGMFSTAREAGVVYSVAAELRRLAVLNKANKG